MTKVGAILVVLQLVLFAATAPLLAAGAPPLISYQGRLTDAAGNPLNGNHTITFSVFATASGGPALWSESYTALSITAGSVSVLLGSIVPLNNELFNSPDRYLGIAVNGGPELSPRRQLVSVAYSQRVATVDGASGGKLVGSLGLSDSLIAPQLRLGSPLGSGQLRLFAAGSAEPVAELKPATLGGGELRLFDPSHAETHLLQPDVSGSGGLLSVRRNAAQAGFVVDGNYAGTQSPRVSIVGQQQTAIFDMSASGDDAVVLPAASINASELKDECGVAAIALSSGSLVIPDTLLVLRSRAIDCPSAGWLMAFASAELTIGHNIATTDEFEFAVSDQPRAISGGQSYTRLIPAAWATATCRDVVTVHGLLPVTSGTRTIYLLGRRISGGAGAASAIQLTLLFVTTSYGVSPPAAVNSEDEVDRR